MPEQLRSRTLAVRGFDAAGMMTGWELTEGGALEDVIAKLFADPRQILVEHDLIGKPASTFPGHAVYLHAHFAAPGCYAARIERA